MAELSYNNVLGGLVDTVIRKREQTIGVEWWGGKGAIAPQNSINPPEICLVPCIKVYCFIHPYYVRTEKNFYYYSE